MSGRRNPGRRGAFTLLEMMLALMITSMTVMTLYRFVSTHLTTVRVSTELGEDRATLDAVVQFVQAQMNSLPPADGGAIKGQAFKFHGLSGDELTWRCSAGPGLLTSSAPGEFLVTLALQPTDGKSNEGELGLRRQPAPENKASLDLKAGGAGGHYDWLPLIRPMAAMEIRYFDAQSHSWSDAWTDPVRRPAMLRLRLWRNAGDAPLEATFPVPSSRITQ